MVHYLLGILYFLFIAMAVAFVCFTNRINDLSVLRENLKNELIVNDLKHIVQAILQKSNNEYEKLQHPTDR